MSGWQLRAGTASATIPSGTSVEPEQSITIHTATGTNSDEDVYLGAAATQLLAGIQSSPTVTLLDARGATVVEVPLPR